MTEIATIPQRRELQVVVDAVPLFDTSHFEHMQRVASIMARSSMIPETLRTVGPKDNKQDLPFEQVMANCFLVVNQAVRWQMDPFAVISCCSVVHGRLAYEGKLVAAVLNAKLGISLHHHFVGEPTSEAYRIYLSDEPFAASVIEQLKPGIKMPLRRLWDGSVTEWKTTGVGTPWTPKNFPRMLIYRGTRDWTRIYEPAVLLGVYTDDELLDLAEDARARRATPVASLADRLSAARNNTLPAAAGFSINHIETETGAQREAAGTDDSPPPSASMASEREPEASGSGEAHDRMSESASPTDSDSSRLPRATDEPAAVNPAPIPAAAGDLSNPSDQPAPADGPSGEDGTGHASPSSLPAGWPIQYAAALRRAQKKESLPKYATEFWKGFGGWAAYRDGVDGATATAIYDAFANNFGDKAAIDDLLRELV